MLFRTGRTATSSVKNPNATATPMAPRKPSQSGTPSTPMNHDPNTAPIIPSWPGVKLTTFEVEYIML
jgi:hypothetical protein